MKRIRPKDEQYWKEHRGTPKAFVALDTGKQMWGNSFGYCTAIRFPSGTKENIENRILEQMTPSDAGLAIQPVREQAIAAATQSEDFGGLFIGFSFFLIVAALILLTLLFQFSLEKRATETGVLLAVGLPPKQVRRLMLLEGMIVAVLGGVVGGLAGLGYAAAILHDGGHGFEGNTEINGLAIGNPPLNAARAITRCAHPAIDHGREKERVPLAAQELRARGHRVHRPRDRRGQDLQLDPSQGHCRRRHGFDFRRA